jgi:hypothetical protein
MKCKIFYLAAVFAVALGHSERLQSETITHPLRVHYTNPRFFSDANGRAIYLTGSHTWDNFLDWGGKVPNFDYSAYLDFLSSLNHNFIRFWVGTSRLDVNGEVFRSQQTPWKRTGPGLAKDGSPKFDLYKFNEDYFARLRARALEAEKKGIYVSVMLFNGLFDWEGHPFNILNNINQVDGDSDRAGNGDSIFDIRNADVLAVQKAYIKKVVDSVGDLNNVLFEVGNEIKGHSVRWQYYIIDYIHQYEKTREKQHPVGMTGGGDGLSNRDLFNSPAEWISPRVEPDQDYFHNPPASLGQKVIISDTDHIGGVLDNPSSVWVWRSFLRGLNPILMDVLQNKSPGYDQKWNLPNRPGLRETREAMGQAQRYASRMSLSRMAPTDGLASTKFCLSNGGAEYLVYLPFEDIPKTERILKRLGIIDSKIAIDLSGAPGALRMEWFNPKTNVVIDGGTVSGGARVSLSVPFVGDAVLYLHRESS